MKKAYIILVFIGIALNAFPGNTPFEEKFKEGNRLYTAGQFNDALKIYSEIAESEFESPELFFNMANCYYRLNNVGLSIYWYKKAELLNPSDDDIKYNLELANLRVQNQPPEMPQTAVSAFYENLVLSFPIQVWGMASLIFFALFLGLIFLKIKSKTSKRKKLAVIFAALALMIALTTILFTSSQYKKVSSNDKAVVISRESIVKSAPGQGGTDLFPVYEGFYVKIESTSGNQAEIKLSDGRKGWISLDQIKIL